MIDSQVPYYAALKKFRDYLNGAVAVLDENDVVFQYCKLKTFPRASQPQIKEEIKTEPGLLDELDEFGSSSPAAFCDEYRAAIAAMPNNNNFCAAADPATGAPPKMLVDSSTNAAAGFGCDGGPCVGAGPVIVKKKRGRPKKVRPVEENAAKAAAAAAAAAANRAMANVTAAAGPIQQPLANGNLW